QNRKIPVPSHKPDEQGDFSTNTELGAFLDDFVEAYRLIVPPEKQKPPVTVEQRKKPAATSIILAFWTCQQNDIQAQAFPQHRITIRVERGFDLSDNAMRIPDDAAVITNPNTNAAIGIESLYDEKQTLKQYSWGELHQTITARQDGDD